MLYSISSKICDYLTPKKLAYVFEEMAKSCS